MTLIMFQNSFCAELFFEKFFLIKFDEHVVVRKYRNHFSGNDFYFIKINCCLVLIRLQPINHLFESTWTSLAVSTELLLLLKFFDCVYCRVAVVVVSVDIDTVFD